MNKSISIVILAAIFLCGNASIFGHLYNNTHLKGDIKLDTTDGVKLGYNGGLHFDNGFLGFEIANVAGNLKAAVRPGGKYGKQTESSVDYAGDIQVSHGNHSANISVNGTAGVNAEYETKGSANGGNFSYNATFTDNNQWTVSAGDKTANGTSGGCLDVSAQVEKDGNKITVEKLLRGGVEHNGTVNNGDKEDTFKVGHYGAIKLDKEIYIKNSSEESHGSFGNVFPTIAYSGHAKVKRGGYLEWNNETVSSKGKGKGRFSGLIWYDKADTNDTYVRSVKHAKSAEYVHGGKVKVNDELHDIYGGAGIISAIDSATMTYNNETKEFKGGFFDSGNLHHVGIDIAKPDSNDELLLKNMQNSPTYVLAGFEGVDNVENVDKKPKKVKTITSTGWVAGKGVHVQHDDNGTVTVNTHGGAVWETDGFASNSKKPIHETGENTYNSSFVYDKNTSMIKNFLMKFGKDPKAIEDLRRKYKMLKVAAQ